jgi:hypothetical protein
VPKQPKQQPDIHALGHSLLLAEVLTGRWWHDLQRAKQRHIPNQLAVHDSILHVERPTIPKRFMEHTVPSIWYLVHNKRPAERLLLRVRTSTAITSIYDTQHTRPNGLHLLDRRYIANIRLDNQRPGEQLATNISTSINRMCITEQQSWSSLIVCE